MPSERGSLPPEPARVAVDIRRFPWVRKLATDYVFAFPALAPFFAGDPATPASWQDAIGRAQARPRPRREITAILQAQQRRRDAAPAAFRAAALLEDPRAIAVVTGQQAGLFGGPFFTVLKAVTAVKLAERVSRDYGVPSVPIFWIEAEDHDWDEVSSCSVLDGELQRRTVVLQRHAGAGQMPVAAIRLTHEIERTLADLTAALPRTEFTDPLLDDLRRTYRPDVGMAEAFGCWMETLASRFGLVVFDASDPAAKPHARQIFARELRHPGRTWQLACAAGEGLVDRGYHQQVAAQEGPALFRLDGTRRPIRLQGDHFVIGDQTVEAVRLLEDVERQPATFSPNVLLRPIVQDSLLPTVCYVCGPNELAYLAQLRGVYEHFGIAMPLAYPRASATVLDAAAARFLLRHDLSLESFQPQDDRTLNRLLAESLPDPVDRTLGQAMEAVRTSMEALAAAVPSVDPTLEGAARSTQGRLQHELEALRGKIIGAAKRRDETLRRQFARARAQAFPDGEPQERAIGVVSLLNRYGPALMDRLVAKLPLEPGHHWALTL